MVKTKYLMKVGKKIDDDYISKLIEEGRSLSPNINIRNSIDGLIKLEEMKARRDEDKK